jgi:hypothetical protein
MKSIPRMFCREFFVVDTTGPGLAGLDDRLDVAHMASNENPRPGPARRTLKGPIRPLRRSECIERPPRKPSKCLV